MTNAEWRCPDTFASRKTSLPDGGAPLLHSAFVIGHFRSSFRVHQTESSFRLFRNGGTNRRTRLERSITKPTVRCQRALPPRRKRRQNAKSHQCARQPGTTQTSY